MVFSKLVTRVTWPVCSSWFCESVSQGVLAPFVLQSWSIIIWLPPSKQFVFFTAKRVLPRWSSPWLLGMVNIRSSNWYWDPLLLGLSVLSIPASPLFSAASVYGQCLNWSKSSFRFHQYILQIFTFGVTLWLEERPIYMIKPTSFLSIRQVRCHL